MNCTDCEHNHGGTGRETEVMSGYEILVPCIMSATGIGGRPRHIGDDCCNEYVQKKIPVDPNVTRDSTCGDCGLRDETGRCDVLSEHAKMTVLVPRDRVACIEIEVKETTHLLAEDCPHHTDHTATKTHGCWRDAIPYTTPKTAFAPTEPKPTPERPKPTHQQCLGVLDYDKGQCQVMLPYNAAKRLCPKCTSRNAGQSRTVSSAPSGGAVWKMSGSNLNAT
jgi:hypothetical protein